LLLPLFLLLVPIALFEKLGALASLKRSVSIGKRNYLRLLGFWFLLLVLLLVLSLIVSFVQVGLNIIPIAGAALGFVISVVFNVWASLFSVLAVVMLYNELASPLAFEKPSLAPSFSKAKQAKRKPRKKKR
jgi:predicted membrane protein